MLEAISQTSQRMKHTLVGKAYAAFAKGVLQKAPKSARLTQSQTDSSCFCLGYPPGCHPQAILALAQYSQE